MLFTQPLPLEKGLFSSFNFFLCDKDLREAQRFFFSSFLLFCIDRFSERVCNLIGFLYIYIIQVLFFFFFPPTPSSSSYIPSSFFSFYLFPFFSLYISVKTFSYLIISSPSIATSYSLLFFLYSFFIPFLLSLSLLFLYTFPSRPYNIFPFYRCLGFLSGS